jgi:probable F420-dependent oxidoreductase
MEFWQAVSFTETEQLIEIARFAEEVGFAGLGLAEHLVTPETITSKYPYTPDGKVWWDPTVHWPEPWAMAAVLATHTARLRFITNIYVLPMHDVFTAAKAVSTAAYLSGNRIILGAAVGWMKDEFLLTGQDFHTRGRRTDEMLGVMQKLFGGGMVEHHGEFIDFPPVQMAPVPTEPVPVYIGGESEAALRRAATWDGWFAGGPYTPEQLLAYVARLGELRRELGRADRDFGIIAGLAVPPDLDLFKRLGDAGVTGITNVPWYYQGTPTSTIEHKRDTLARFAENFIVPLSG